MDKKMKQKHTGNKPKQQSTMKKKEEKQQQNENHKSKSIYDILPLELIHRILFRVPLKDLGRLKCVSKLCNTLISDPDFAKLHLHLSAAPAHVCLFVYDDDSNAVSVDIDAAFHRHTAVKEVSLPLKMNTPFDFKVMCSCRGLLLLHRAPHFLIVWNPLIGSSKKVSYSHIVSRIHRKYFMFPDIACLYGFGYDALQDDYLVVVASQDKNDQEHFDCLSLRTNSWTNLDFALSKPLGTSNWQSRGFFLNGAIHWASFRFYSILIFDLKERSFSTISMPEQVMGYLDPTHLILLGGCLALYSCDSKETNIWVMKEYKVHSSWTFYQISHEDCVPLCLSNGSDIVALDSFLISRLPCLYFAKYNVRGELLQLKYVQVPCRDWSRRYMVYTESLVPVPSEIKDKDKDKKKKNGRQNQKNDVKQEKRTRSECGTSIAECKKGSVRHATLAKEVATNSGQMAADPQIQGLRRSVRLRLRKR
ncbi:F-box/kelch-repeat protein At3g06240-like [Arachis stenosperma]|uniref:F-box/kelch-repeat protein At3g06240-like n=1 Tax=Arachis stenosperma TaxID=217475 RepID=UPI0025AC809C|nr:F-box/kelch-repeat protein At3g06240-like [Arachis stenosperma]